MLQRTVVSDTKSSKPPHRGAALLYGSMVVEVYVELQVNRL